MKILFVNEYFYPFDVGGAEWSAYWQAIKMPRDNFQIFVLTPNYGTIKREASNGITIMRFPFIKSSNVPINPLFHQNIFWYLWSALWIWFYSKKLKIGLVHVHGKQSVPGAIISRMFGGPKVITSIRDYSPLCRYGFCLWNKKRAHSISEYFFKELPFYIRNYSSKIGLSAILKQLLLSPIFFWQLFCLRFFIKKSDKIVFISNYIKDVYQKNGFQNLQSSVIYNLPPLIAKLSPDSIKAIKTKFNLKNKKIILSVGKVSLGKGSDLLIKTVDEVVSKIKDAVFVFAGPIALDKKIIYRLVSAENIKNIIMLGKINHHDMGIWYKISSIVCIPSVWPEPFGRIAIEALQYKKPIITSGKGGLKEILQKSSNTLFVDVNNESAFSKAIIKTLKSPSKQNTSKNKELNEKYIIKQWDNLYSEYGKF